MEVSGRMSESNPELAEFIDVITAAFGLDDRQRNLVGRLSELHDLAQQLLADVILSQLEAGRPEPDPSVFAQATPVIVERLRSELEPLRGELVLLAVPSVSEAFAVIALGGSDDDGGVLGLQLMVEALTIIAPHRARAAVLWLGGRGSDRAGYALDAEAAYEQALSLDPTWSPTLESLAALANDRGDAERGLRLLDRAGVDPEDGLYRLLSQNLPDNVVPLNRNHECWCGSGRKLKQCHRTAAPRPLSERASWLYHKASAFLQDGPWRDDILELAQERSRYGDQRELIEALGDPLVMSAMLFEGGVLEVYADTRGRLLPEDEFDLLLHWINADRGLYEVEEVQRDLGLLVRNLLDGERTFVHEILGSRQAHVGMFFVTLVLPVDDEQFGFFGGIEPVSLTERHDVLEMLADAYSPLELVSVMTDRLAPPRFTTSSGEDLEHNTTVIRVKGRKVIARAFDQQFTRSDANTWTVGLDGGPIEPGTTVGGTLEVTGRTLTITTMSRERMDMIVDIIEDLGFDFEVVSEDRLDVAAMMARHAEPDANRERSSVLSGPEADEALSAYIRSYEEQWLDMDIPALQGLTPRQAAADPSMRPDLIALLNSFPPGTANTMDPDRLRAALGL